jgi:hypothetical protein
MRHLFNRGFINQWEYLVIREALLALRPEIWKYCGRKVELNGLLYVVIERLPQGIENVIY